MDQQFPNQPTPTPIQPAVPGAQEQQFAQQPPLQQPSKRLFDLRYLFIILILIGLSGSLFMVTKGKTTTLVPTPTETPTPTPKVKPVVSMATESAYLELIQGVASLSAHINALEVSDSTLIPPTIELQLGFTNQ